MQQKIGTGLLFAGQFVAGALALYHLGEMFLKLLSLLGTAIALLWASSESDLDNAGHRFAQFIAAAAGLILLSVASWLLAKTSERSWLRLMIVGLIAGAILVVGKFSILPTGWKEAIFGPDGLAFAIVLVFVGWALTNEKRSRGER